jgi:hypothetical protein
VGTMHHTKEKGDSGVFHVMLDLQNRGYVICVPLTEHAPFDLVVCRDDKCFRIQVKYRTIRNGTVSISKRTSWADKNGTHAKHYAEDVFDFFAIYCPETNQCYYVPFQSVESTFTIRIQNSKNNQAKNIHLADEYLKAP